jgi:hypothetical protein
MESKFDSIQESPWDLNGMLERFAFKNTYKWLSSDNPHSVIAKIAIPFGLLTNTLLSNPFSNFQQWRGDVELRIQVFGTPFHQGKLLGVFIPLSSQQCEDRIISNFASCMANPCVHLFPNANTSSVLTIPFNSPQLYLDLTDSNPFELNTLGTFYIIVMNPLQYAAGSSDTVTVSLFSRFLNNQFKVPRLSTASPFTRAIIALPESDDVPSPRPLLPTDEELEQIRSELDYLRLNRQHARPKTPPPYRITSCTLPSAPIPIPIGKLLPTLPPFIKADPQAGSENHTTTAKTNAIQKLTAPVTNLLSAGLSSLGKAVSSVLPVKTIGDTLTNFLPFLDKPTDPNQTASVLALTNRANFATGVEHIDKLVVNPSQLFDSTNLTFGTTHDETLMSYLTSKFTYLGSFTVDTKDEPGKNIASFPINPIPSLVGLVDSNRVPLISYMSFPFAYWRGGLTYRLEVVATSLQTCKLFIAYNFGLYETAPVLPLAIATSQYGEAFEINQGTNQIEVTVPFVSNTPYKFVPNSNTYTSDNSTGYINVIILNPLVAPSNTPTTITVNVYMAGATDYELSTLTLANCVIPAIPQSDDITTNVMPPMSSESTDIDLAEDKLVAPPSTIVPRHPLSVISERSLCNYLSKYQDIGLVAPSYEINGLPVYSFKVNEIFTSTFINASSIPPPTPSSVKSTTGLFAHFTSLFRQFRGGLRFKILDFYGNNERPFPTTETLQVYYCPPLPPNFASSYEDTLNAQFPNFVTTSFSDGSPSARTFLRLPMHIYGGATCRSAEFEIPFTSRFVSTIIGNPAETTYTDLGEIFIYTTSIVSGTPAFRFLVSFADETRVGNLFCVPTITPSFAIRNVAGTNTAITLSPDDYVVTPPITNTLIVL